MIDSNIRRVIPGFPDYDVGEDGSVRRITGGKGVRAGRVLKPVRNNNGYYQVGVYREGRCTLFTVHGLVTSVFLGPRPDGYEVNHRDGDKANNALTNLEYCTSVENKQHASGLGLLAFGDRNKSTKLNDEQVAAVRELARSGLSQREVGGQFGISQGHVSDIVSGKKRKLREQ